MYGIIHDPGMETFLPGMQDLDVSPRGNSRSALAM